MQNITRGCKTAGNVNCKMQHVVWSQNGSPKTFQACSDKKHSYLTTFILIAACFTDKHVFLFHKKNSGVNDTGCFNRQNILSVVQQTLSKH